MAEWIDVRERLPENSDHWEKYIVAVVHAKPLYFIGNTFVAPALYNSQQKMWIVLWGPGESESEHLNALISPEKSQPDEHCVAYWMNMPKPPEVEGCGTQMDESEYEL